ncbi:MAG: DUF418 domain-containing protein [Ilumatobacteraceae bacterium]
MVEAASTASLQTPVGTGERITNLDAMRGIAVLGIVVMNAVSYGLPEAAYFNLSAAGSDNWLDWVIGVTGEIFVDQKTMALFSMLFGAGIVLFAERAQAKGANAGRLSLWRNFLLLIIGLVHGLLWEGDVLFVYALCAPLLIALRKRQPRTLLIAGTAVVLWSAVLAVIVQTTIPADGDGLGEYWFTNGSAMSDAVGLFLLNDFFARAFGMMLIGVALYRLDVLQGTRPTAFYRSMVRWGLGIGVPIAAAGVAIQATADFSPDIAIIGEAPNTLATIPIALGYVGAITLWNQRPTTELHEHLRAAGRMALTNYLTQTILGVIILRGLLSATDLTRTAIAVFIVGVWALQLAWSKPWLDRFRFGPFEWAWRCGTYRKIQPIRRAPT